jgi:hypothetical protein
MPHIDDVWLFLSIDEDGDEGVCAFHAGDVWMPMIATDLKRVESFKPLAQRMVAEGGMPIRLVKFTQRVDVETYE